MPGAQGEHSREQERAVGGGEIGGDADADPVAAGSAGAAERLAETEEQGGLRRVGAADQAGKLDVFEAELPQKIFCGGEGGRKKLGAGESAFFARRVPFRAAQCEAILKESRAGGEAGLGLQHKDQGKFQRKSAEIECKDCGGCNIYDQNCAPPGEL